MPGRHPRPLTVSAKELLVLDLLVRDRELYGLQLVAASRGRLKRGTVYVTLGRMEAKGYITSTLEDPPPASGGLPRRLYRPTTLGRRMRSAWTSAAARLTPEFAR
jgi:DNA-binding PadR family transcriptional regulator